MALPETVSSYAALIAELVDVRRKLEVADENENPMERFFTRERLLEQQDELQAEIVETASPSEQC